jgi:hypothetical protein
MLHSCPDACIDGLVLPNKMLVMFLNNTSVDTACPRVAKWKGMISAIFFIKYSCYTLTSRSLVIGPKISRLAALLVGSFLIAWWYLTLNIAAVVLKSLSLRQHVFIEHDPDTPWHLHLSFIVFIIDCIPTWWIETYFYVFSFWFDESHNNWVYKFSYF